MKQAVRPNYFSGLDNLKSLQPVRVKDDEEIDVETQNLHALSQTAGWKVFLERAGSIMNDLDSLTTAQMVAGADEASIGRSTIVKEITKDVIRRLLNIVQDAYESVEGRRGV